MAGWDLTADPDATPPEALPEGVHTVVVGIGDQNGILRGKRVTAAHWPGVRRRGIALDNTFFAMNVGSVLVPNGFSGPETGYPDLAVRPRGPLRPYPGEAGVALCLGAAAAKGGGEIPIDPRAPLLRAVAACREAGFEPRLAAELEFYLADPATGRPREARQECYGLGLAAELEPFLGPLRRDLAAMGIPVEQSNPEFSAGQVEVNLGHAPALEAMDHALLLRAMTKQAARRAGRVATFMPMPYAGQSGNGFHLHVSVWREGRNLFADKGKLSALGRAWLGGMQAVMPEASIVGSTHPNAYRRRRAGAFSPTEATWGWDNRTVALRVMEGEGPDDDAPVRLEERHAAADCNPYLLAAVALFAGLRGVREGLAPTRPTLGDAYAQAGARRALPRSVAEAAALARGSAFLRECLGDVLLDLVITNAEREAEILDAEVPPGEIRRYLDAM